MSKTLKSFYFGLVFLFLFLAAAAPAKAEVAAPKIIKITVAEEIALAGLAPVNSEVLIYLDGKSVGRTEVKDSRQAEPSFSFQFKPEVKLADGTHILMAAAQDKTSLVMSAPSAEIKFAVNEAPAPTLIKPEPGSSIGQNNQLVGGLTKSGTRVLLYLNGILLDKTEILKHESGTANFFFKNNLSLGQHELYVVAEDANQKISQPSRSVNFKIEPPMPAPTMFPPVVNLNTTATRPFIVGLAKNDSLVKVYIDKKYSGEFSVKNHQSGTANFAYRPDIALSRGGHQAYTVALDRRGKASINSNLINFKVKAATIAQGAEEARRQAVPDIKEAQPSEKTESAAPVISGSTGRVENQPASKPAEPPASPAAVKPEAEKQRLTIPENIEDWLGTSSAPVNKAAQGLVNEGEQNQGKLKLSVALFILFLVGVVGWLLWVNRELIKERRAQAEAAEKSAQNEPLQSKPAPDEKADAPDKEPDKLL